MSQRKYRQARERKRLTVDAFQKKEPKRPDFQLQDAFRELRDERRTRYHSEPPARTPWPKKFAG